MGLESMIDFYTAQLPMIAIGFPILLAPFVWLERRRCIASITRWLRSTTTKILPTFFLSSIGCSERFTGHRRRNFPRPGCPTGLRPRAGGKRSSIRCDAIFRMRTILRFQNNKYG